MSSIIINSFYRALTNINENEGIKNLDVKQLTRLLVDILYPEDGVLTWEDDKTLKIKFNGKVPVEEETQTVEVTIPVSEPAPAEPAPAQPEVKEIKVKEVKPKLSKEEKAAQKAEKEAKAAEAKAVKEAKAAKPKAAKAKPSAEPAPAPAEPEPAPAPAPAPAEPKATKPKATKPKFAGNLEKLNATQEKAWKKVAANANVTLTDDHRQRFIAQMNELENTVYNTKKLEAWMTEFFTPKQPEMKTKDEAMFPVEYKGKEYFVDDDGNVYEIIPGTDIHKKVGNVGMAYFSELEMPTE
jgi:hypothetical protein